MNKKKIGIGFVGAGWMGSALLRKLVQREDVKIWSLHQRSKKKALKILQELGLEKNCYEPRFTSLLENPKIEAIFICSSNEAHGPQAIAAQKAGKHVFCEKPCATSFTDFCQQIELENSNPNQVTYVDYLMNFDSLEKQIQGMVQRGDFGTITQIQVNYRHPVNISEDKVWKLSATQIGDAIGMGIIHSFSVMLNIMLAQGAKPVSVYASNSSIHTRPFEIPALWNLHIAFSNGGTGFCFGNIDQANGYDAYHNIHGTSGGLIFDSYLNFQQKIRFWSLQSTKGKWVYPLDPDRCMLDGMEEHVWPAETTTPDSGDVMSHQTGACLEHFLNCITSGKQSFLSFANSAVVAELGWAAQISAARNLPVTLPLDWQDASYFFSKEKK